MSSGSILKNSPPQVIGLGLQPSWHSAIRRALETRGHASKTSMVTALDWDDLLEETQARPASLVAIEWNAKNLLATCRQVQRVANNPYSAKFVSLAKPEHRESELLLRQFGFVDCLWSVIQAERLVKMAERLADQVPFGSQSIEESVWSRLPWKARHSPAQ